MTVLEWIIFSIGCALAALFLYNLLTGKLFGGALGEGNSKDDVRDEDKLTDEQRKLFEEYAEETNKQNPLL